MSTLTNTQIRHTYDALLKLADNGNLTTVLKEITDGLGNVTPLSISQIAIKSSVDIEASGFKTPTGTSSQFLKADGSVDGSTYLTSYTETDPIFTAHVANAITSTDLTNYDTAYTHSQSAHAPPNAEQNVQSDWDSTAGDSLILNKPTIPSGNNIIDWTGASAGTIHITNLPATAITSVQIASTQVAMLALTTQEGDVVVRSDENKTYMHNGGTAGTMADFTELSSPTGGVSSVDGATGAVVLNHDTLTGFVANEHIDWTTDQGATNIHAGNYTNTTYTNVSEFTNDAGYTGDQDLSGYSLTSHNHTFASLTSKPTTIAGYGITDGIVTTDARLSNARTATLTGNLLTAVPSGALFTDTTYDLSGYLLNTTDTLTGTLIVNGGTGVSSSGTLLVQQNGDGSGSGITLTSSNATSHRIWKGANGSLNIGPSSLPSSFVQTTTGNVGIGTASPDTKLHIADSTSPIFTFERLDTTTIANEVIGQLNFKSTDSTDIGVNASIKVIKQDLPVATVPMAITFETGVSGTVAERMRIDSVGNVGIGTNSPGERLTVTGNTILGFDENRPVKYDSASGDFRITPNAAGWASGYFFNQTDGTYRGGFGGFGGNNTLDYFWIGDNYNDTTMVIEPGGGNVGIGTTSPRSNLDIALTASEMVYPSATGTSPNGGLRIGYNVATWGGVELNMGIANASAQGYPAWIQAQNPANLSVSRNLLLNPNGGNVGIGTTSPVEKLYVNSISGDARIGLNAPTGSDTEIKFSNNGVVQYSIGHDDATDNFVIGTANVDTPKVSINKTGNVGIGTTSPSYKLDVSGNGRFTSTVTATNFILSSDKRLKKDLLPLYSKRLSPSRWTWIDSGEKDFGFIAQELEVDFPEVVVTGEDGFKKVAYNKITAINSARVNELEDEVYELKRKLELIMQKLGI